MSLPRPLLQAAALLALTLSPSPSPACCPAPSQGKAVVNADQTVILVWDPAHETEHFIRRASFQSEAEDFGFLVPGPYKPELEEAGDSAFPALQKLTEPEIIRRSRPNAGCGACGGVLERGSKSAAEVAPAQVAVLEQKTVAGFHASVLEVSEASALTGWLQENGYAYSPEVEAWARPYIADGWKITALRVAKKDNGDPGVTAAALRMSFRTARPLFPYREPDTSRTAPALGARRRLLRLYFVSDARYDGQLEGAP